MATFDQVAAEYGKRSLVQAAAADKLLSLLHIQNHENILDVGCGPGNITARIKGMTSGRVEGTDISEGMITQAKEKNPEIHFRKIAMEQLDYVDEFDIVFCNSTFQWVKDFKSAILPMHKALKAAGRLGIACPATQNWSPCFQEVAEFAGSQPETSALFSHWRSPWLWLQDENFCRTLFGSCGFDVDHLKIEKEVTYYTAEEAYSNFLSGAGQGYMSASYYDVPLTREYLLHYKKYLETGMQARVVKGRVEVDFNRLYFVGKKR